MPKLADTLVEGTLGRWLKQVGDPIERGEPLASIETDKVTTALTSPAAGTLLEVLVAEGSTVPIETPIARIGSAAPSTAPGAAPVDDLPSATAPAGGPRKATPVAARLLAENGLRPEDVPPGRGAARVRRDDVLAFIQTRQPATVAATQPSAPLTSMRRAIAEHMTRARQTIPHGLTVMAADLTPLVAWRELHKRDDGANLTFTVVFVHALARTLATLIEPPTDIGVAVALDAGLIVPVLRNAGQLTLVETARGIADLATRARANQLAANELQGARMTLTNVGSFGNLTAAPIIPLGQIGILGPGIVDRRAYPTADGGIRPGWRCLLSLSFDRRAFSDLAADHFLRQVVAELSSISVR